MINTDRPIQNKKEDLLNRGSFASNLANTIIKYSEEECVTLGLIGKWGSGKTSLINLTLENLNPEEIIIVKFNPWNYSEQNQIINQFFIQLGNKLKYKRKDKQLLEIAKKLEFFGYLSHPLKLYPPTQPIGLILGQIFSFLGKSSSKWASIISKDLKKIKLDLEKLLSKIDQKILIMIDDVDRLNNKEIKQMFQLVKSLGDFPNIIYLMAFDNEIVEHALIDEQKFSSKYIEKIVQVSFSVPMPNKKDVEKILFAELDKILDSKTKKRFDQNYWTNIYQNGLKHLFNSVRDVKRYINTLKFNNLALGDNVNIVDLFAITAIQIFLPSVHHEIKNNAMIFTGSSNDITSHNKDELKTKYEQIKKLSTLIPNDSFDRLMAEIFPKTKAITANTNYGSEWLINWRRNGRICHPEMFLYFFRLNIPENTLTISDMENIIDSISSVDKFKKSLKLLLDSEKILLFLSRFEDYTENYIPEEKICIIIRSLIESSLNFPEQRTGMLQISTKMQISRIFYQLLSRIKDENDKLNHYLDAIKNINLGIDMCVYFIALEIGAKDDNKLFDQNSKKELIKAGTQIIKNFAKDSQDSKIKNIIHILKFVEDYFPKNQIKKTIIQILESNPLLIQLIQDSITTKYSQTMGSYSTNVTHDFDFKGFEAYFEKTDENLKRLIKIRKQIKDEVLFNKIIAYYTVDKNGKKNS